MLRDTGSSKKAEAYGSMSCEEAAGECLLITKLDYASVVFDPLPAYQLRRLPESAKCMCGVFVKEIRLMSLTFLRIFN